MKSDIPNLQQIQEHLIFRFNHQTDSLRIQPSYIDLIIKQEITNSRVKEKPTVLQVFG